MSEQQKDQRSQASSKEERCEKLKDLVVEKQQTKRQIAELDNQIQKLERSQKADD